MRFLKIIPRVSLQSNHCYILRRSAFIGQRMNTIVKKKSSGFEEMNFVHP